MDNALLHKLLGEVRLQCRFGQHAFKEVAAAIQMNDPERAFYYVEGMLHHGVELAKLLWPARPESRERGGKLCDVLKVTVPSPLELRDWRAWFASWDERLVTWAESSEPGSFASLNMMPVGTLEGFKADSFHRTLDTETFRGAIQGIPFDLNQLAKELQKLDRNADLWLRSNRSW